MKGKKQLLMLLGVLLVAALYYAFMAMPSRQKVPAPVRSVAPTKFPGLQNPPVEQKILLERLQRKNKISAAVKRDIFNFYVKPVVVKQPVQVKPVAPPPPPVVPVIPVRPPPQVVSVDVKYLGLLEKGGRQVFFLGLDGEVVVARLGQKFGDLNQYSIKSYDGEQLILSQDGNRPDINLKVGEVTSRSRGHASAGVTLPFNASSQRPADVNVTSQRPANVRSQGHASEGISFPDNAGPQRQANDNATPQRPANAPRLKSFKIRKPAVFGQ